VGSDYDPSDALSALRAVHEAERANRHVTGLLYYDPAVPTATDALGLTDTPLMALPEDQMRPSRESLESVNAHFRAD
jgi:hypothetical protein